MCFSTWQYCKNALFQNWRENNSRKTFLLISFGLTFNWKMFWNFISGTNTTNAFGLALPCASNKAPNRAFVVEMPLLPIVTLILYFVSLLLTSPSFSLSLDYSTLFLWLPFTSSSLPAYLRMFPILPISMTFSLCTISDWRMFFVPILTWSIRNTVSVLWKLLFIVLPLFTKRFYTYLWNWTADLCFWKRLLFSPWCYILYPNGQTL